jgi:bifunctional non-homologous end joining protein LigD
MLPHIAARPLNLERYPDGIDGPRIIQQRASQHFPPWVRRVTVPSRGGMVAHVVASDAAALVYLADQACITLHPWLSRADRLDRPDRMIFDLDPSGETPDEVRGAAAELGALLRDLGLEPFVMAPGRAATTSWFRSDGTRTSTRSAVSPATSRASPSPATRD